MWAHFGWLYMLGSQCNFMRKALWKKVVLGARICRAYHQPNCVLCSVLENVNQTLSRCRFLEALPWSNDGMSVTRCNSLKLSTEIAHVATCESHVRSSIASSIGFHERFLNF